MRVPYLPLLLLALFTTTPLAAQQAHKIELSAGAAAGLFSYRWAPEGQLKPIMSLHARVEVLRYVFLRGTASHAWSRQALTCVDFGTCPRDQSDKLLLLDGLVGVQLPIGRVRPYVAVGRERVRTLDHGDKFGVSFENGQPVDTTVYAPAVKYVTIVGGGFDVRASKCLRIFVEHMRRRDVFLEHYPATNWDISSGVSVRL